MHHLSFRPLIVLNSEVNFKKFDKFRLVEFFYPLRKQWHIITLQRVSHHRRCISSAAGCILFRNDDIQRQAVDDIRCSASMICTPFGVIWVQIHTEKRKISFLSSLYKKKAQPQCRAFFLLIRKFDLSCVSKTQVRIPLCGICEV